MKAARGASNPRAVPEPRSVDVEASSPVDHVDLTFHGAAQTDTGSCTEIATGVSRLLVDRSLFQRAVDIGGTQLRAVPLRARQNRCADTYPCPYRP